MKTQIKQFVKEGDMFSVYFNGKEFRGELIKLDENNPTYPVVHMGLEDGSRLMFPCPTNSNNMAIRVDSFDESENEPEEDMDEKDSYSNWSKVELKTEAIDRGLKVPKSVSKKGLINLLTFNDSEKEKVPSKSNDYDEEDSHKTKKKTKKKLSGMKLKELRPIARELGISVKGLDKNILIKKIKRARSKNK